jgi:CDP-diacylglycerol--glycerol-3-phosphate 3-phosphatidyltransferase
MALLIIVSGTYGENICPYFDMHKRSYYIINSITIYRLITAPLLIFLALDHRIVLFKWLLAVSFFTDAIDGFLSRRYHVSSKLGSRLDSIADDFTVIAAIVGIFVFKPGFIRHELIILGILFGLYILQTVMAMIQYGKITSFHTYLAKIAAVLQGIFLLLIFFLSEPPYEIFYAAAIITALDLMEEIILVLMLQHWQTDVKGLYWIIKRKR